MTTHAVYRGLSRHGRARKPAGQYGRPLLSSCLLFGVQVAQLPGSSHCHVVLDAAHTAESAAALAATLRSAFPTQPLVLLLAMAADKQHRCVMIATGPSHLCCVVECIITQRNLLLLATVISLLPG